MEDLEAVVQLLQKEHSAWFSKGMQGRQQLLRESGAEPVVQALIEAHKAVGALEERDTKAHNDVRFVVLPLL